MAAHLYLGKDNDDLVSHCKCEAPLIGYPPQMDCPWCGCGWMFSCIDCRRGFTFARGVEMPESWESLALRDLTKMGTKPRQQDVEGWVEMMQDLHRGVELGRTYVCLDGVFIPADSESISFTGWKTTHELDFVPQVAALKDERILSNLLMDPDYWLPPDPASMGELRLPRVLH